MARSPTKTAGQRLISELSKPGDTYAIEMLIGRAAQIADWLDKLGELINGKRAAWMHVRVNRDQVLEVRIDGAMREARQLTTELRHLLAEIHRQRAAIPMGPGDDGDDLDGID